MEKNTKTPKDFSQNTTDLDSSLNNTGESMINLCDYFNKKDGNMNVIKDWAVGFSKHSNESFCEILSTILQLAGKRVEITPNHIEGDVIDEVFEEFNEGVEMIDNSCDPPIMKFLKDKNSKLFQSFWIELSKTLISNNCLYSSDFNDLLQWVIKFCDCKTKLIRLSASFCAFSLFNSLATSLSKTNKELHKFRQIQNPNEIVKSQISLFEQEMKIYSSASIRLLNKIIINRIFDSDDAIRINAINSLADAIIDYPQEFANYTTLKYIGKALNDKSARNRRDTLRCIQRIFNEIHIDNQILQIENAEKIPIDQISNENDKNTYENNNENSLKSTKQYQQYMQLKEFAGEFAPIILELCNDKDNAVVASGLDCLLAFTEKNLLTDDNNCIYAIDLLSDDSQPIRASAAKFVARQFFKDKNNDLGDFIDFAKNLHDDDLPAVVASLYKSLKCLRKWEKMCEKLSKETLPDNSRIIAKVLLYSAERAQGRLLSSIPESTQKLRKLSLILVRNLPNLIKAYQTDDETVLPLVDAARLIDLDVVSENSYEHFYSKLLSEICNLFLYSTNKEIYTTSISSLYDLSIGTHQLSQVAKKELDRLAVECGKLENSDSIGKFVAAARLVNVSGGGRIRDAVIEQINNSNDSEIVSDCIECLQYVFKWDIKSIHSGKISKNSYLERFHEYLNLFYKIFIQDTNSNHNKQNENENVNECMSGIVKEQAFKAIGSVIALSPFLKNSADENLIPEEIINNFYLNFHHYDIEKKSDLFKFALLPIHTQAIDLSYSVNLLIYYGVEELQPFVKNLWKELIPFKPIPSGKLLSAFKEAHMNNNSIKISARFLFGKINAFTLLNEFLIFENEDESLLPVVLPFFFAINKEQAIELLGVANIKYQEILSKIEAGEKPTQKMFSKLLPNTQNETRKPSHQNNNKTELHIDKIKNKQNDDKNVKMKRSKKNKKETTSSDSESANSDESSNENSTDDNDDIESETN
ncbi:hypothetical protein TRFO_21384 [Tritrichomonas foetus]|uniref:SCD domain-containing protein n=1 Tax=Tritrichomonas foetus TaxID=1144522 RepID=A0A1J4KFF7_9EUKA|nr:hypothetical protein TRFO_21384 [Tritrichomonas foetus]|eukprot:OHT09664.1 hypothetical protein TRFO_21384 [Tritrichomonas foetus]